MSKTSVAAVSGETITALGDELLSSKVPLHSRFRALFTLKSLCASPTADNQILTIVNIIGKGLTSHTTSALLRHELAYVLGQIGSLHAVPILSSVLSDVDGQEEMVRHESAEALAAIGSPSEETFALLRKFATAQGRGGKDDGRVVRETCEVALAKLDWDASLEAQGSARGFDRQYTSVDPAPPLVAHSPLVSERAPSSQTITDVRALRAALLDTHLQLFTRYRAMFSLRNVGTPEAIDALCAGFDDDSALFKHEIAFILGQLAHPHAIPALVRVLSAADESPMVRHEAAEALGGIPGSNESLENPAGDDPRAGAEVLALLKEWAGKKDAPEVVRDSCVVAVDMWEYENSDQFQYADGLSKVAPAVTAIAT